MLAPVRAVVRFMRTLDRAHLRGVFAGRAVTIVENFAPYVFSGAGAVRRNLPLDPDLLKAGKFPVAKPKTPPKP